MAVATNLSLKTDLRWAGTLRVVVQYRKRRRLSTSRMAVTTAAQRATRANRSSRFQPQLISAACRC